MLELIVLVFGIMAGYVGAGLLIILPIAFEGGLPRTWHGRFWFMVMTIVSVFFTCLLFYMTFLLVGMWWWVLPVITYVILIYEIDRI